jgi:hypothetical protein
LAAVWIWDVGRREGFGQPRRRLIWCFVFVASPILEKLMGSLIKECLEIQLCFESFRRELKMGAVLSIDVDENGGVDGEVERNEGSSLDLFGKVVI